MNLSRYAVCYYRSLSENLLLLQTKQLKLLYRENMNNNPPKRKRLHSFFCKNVASRSDYIYCICRKFSHFTLQLNPSKDAISSYRSLSIFIRGALIVTNKLLSLLNLLCSEHLNKIPQSTRYYIYFPERTFLPNITTSGIWQKFSHFLQKLKQNRSAICHYRRIFYCYKQTSYIW